jgi:ParB family chromosome partitioning protein
MELKQIPTDKILANFSQPREKFDKEKIEELASSILSNGLINPIIVREYKNGKYMIVAGERRWRAFRIAGLKTISAFVKDYKDEGEWMIESLIENLQREDLHPLEKAKYAKKIMSLQKIESIRDLAKTIGVSHTTISDWFEMLGMKNKIKNIENVSLTQISETRGLNEKDRIKVIETGVGHRNIREIVKIIKQATPEVKKALLSDEITTEQAERITKLKTPEQRTKAIQEHKNIELVSRNVERNVEHLTTAREKREFDKQLVQAGNWIASFRGCVTDSSKSLERTIKTLLISTKFIPVMDDKQKESLEQQLDRFLEILNKSKQLSEQIEEKL